METKYFSNEDKEWNLLQEAIDTHCGDRSCFDCALLKYNCDSTKLEDLRECYEVLRENNLLPFLVVPAKVMDEPEFAKATPKRSLSASVLKYSTRPATSSAPTATNSTESPRITSLLSASCGASIFAGQRTSP